MTKTCGFLLASLVMAGSVLHATLLSAGDASTVSEFKIKISLDRSTNKVKLACSDGCAWVTTDFACDPEAACSAVVDGYGIMTPVPKSQERATKPPTEADQPSGGYRLAGNVLDPAQ